MGRKPVIKFEQYQDLITIRDLDEFPQLLACLEYLILKESEENLSVEEIAVALARKHGTANSRQGLYYTVEKWRQNGTLEKAKFIFLAPKIEEMRAAVSYAISKMPDLIRLTIDDALKPERSVKQRLDVLTFLANLAQGEMVQRDRGNAEIKFTQRPQIANPIDVPED